jgi:glycosyltransferase involved in cell wall biosynthesis
MTVDRAPTPTMRICIIAQNAYGSLGGGGARYIGGAERQTSMLAKWLAARGHHVSFVTWDEGQPDGEQIDGVTVWKLCAAKAGLPGLRFFYPRLTSLWCALARADADVYYHNSAEAVTGLVAAWCRRHRRSFIYSVASDVACEKELSMFTRSFERRLYVYGLRNAQSIIVQTDRQQHLLRDSFGLESNVLPMPCAFPVISPKTLPLDERRVAWIGRVDSVKRMEWILDVAEALPTYQFDIVAGNYQALQASGTIGKYARDLRDRAAGLKNIIWHDSLSPAGVALVLNQSICLCCTSIYEGFPNTFLEAWSQGRPVISSFDPDSLIQRKGLGSFVRSVNQMVTSIEALRSEEDLWRRQSDNCLKYYSSRHFIDMAMPRFELAFDRAKAGTEANGRSEECDRIGSSDATAE